MAVDCAKHKIRVNSVSPGSIRTPLLEYSAAELARDGKSLTPEEEEAIRRPIMEQYEHEGSPYYSTARLWDDGVLDPVHTRQALALGLSVALNAPIPESRFGVFRM